ncbi:MAG: hypothetical protein U9Q68_07855, partial [Euryarchaeota archaeon]|nr:hypothetical protein [Euryarchaeota archaeon]
KSQAIATIRHLQKIDLFAKTRAECQWYRKYMVIYLPYLQETARKISQLLVTTEKPTFSVS